MSHLLFFRSVIYLPAASHPVLQAGSVWRKQSKALDYKLHAKLHIVWCLIERFENWECYPVRTTKQPLQELVFVIEMKSKWLFAVLPPPVQTLCHPVILRGMTHPWRS